MGVVISVTRFLAWAILLFLAGTGIATSGEEPPDIGSCDCSICNDVSDNVFAIIHIPEHPLQNCQKALRGNVAYWHRLCMEDTLHNAICECFDDWATNIGPAVADSVPLHNPGLELAMSPDCSLCAGNIVLPGIVPMAGSTGNIGSEDQDKTSSETLEDWKLRSQATGDTGESDRVDGPQAPSGKLIEEAEPVGFWASVVAFLKRKPAPSPRRSYATRGDGPLGSGRDSGSGPPNRSVSSPPPGSASGPGSDAGPPGDGTMEDDQRDSSDNGHNNGKGKLGHKGKGKKKKGKKGKGKGDYRRRHHHEP